MERGRSLAAVPWETLSSREIYRNRWTHLKLKPDETEFIEIQAFPFEEALHMVQSGEILDGMTIVAILQAARLHGL